MSDEHDVDPGWWGRAWGRTVQATEVPESIGGRLLVLLGLTGFAISQPLLAVLGDNPATLSQAHVEGRWLIVVGLVIALAPPLALWGLCSVTWRISRRAGDILFLLLVGALAAMAITQFAKSRGITSPSGLLTVAIGTLVLAPVAYRRYGPIADWVRYTALLPLISVVLFLFTSPSGQTLLSTPGDPEPAAGGDARPPVVMIVLDELPTRTLLDDAGQIDERRFPNLAEFAADATWYRRYTTMAPFTFAAVPSLLAGTSPTAQGPYSIYHPNTLFDLLAPTHEVNAIEVATNLCALSSCRPSASPDVDALLDTSIDVLRNRLSGSTTLDLNEFAVDVGSDRPDLGDMIAGREIAGRPDSVVRFIDHLAQPPASGRPPFHYLHLMLPHQPWLFYPDGSLYRDPSPGGEALPAADRQYGERWAPWSASVTHYRHVLQTMYTDRLIGDILDALRDAGSYEESLVVIVADHGISFAPRANAREPSLETIGDIAFVPLLIKAPNQEAGAVSDRNLMSVDVLPTIADVVGVDVGWSVDGYPADSTEIDRRGSTKQWVDLVNPFAPRELGRFEYDGEEIELRRGASTTSWDPLRPVDGLAEFLDVTDVLGRPFDTTFSAPPRGTVSLVGIDDLREPGDEPPLGFVSGVVSGHPSAAGTSIFVLSVNGTVVSGSPVYADAEGALHVKAMLPPHVLDTENEIRAGLVTFLGAVELAIE